MFGKCKTLLMDFVKMTYAKPFSLPLIRKRIGPRWYLSSWWPCESIESMQYSLLSLLAVAHAERLDPKPLIVGLASEHRGRYRRLLTYLARRLEGCTLVQALEKTPDALSDDVVLAIRFGVQSGTLSPTYAQLVETQKPKDDVLRAAQRNAKGYGAFLAAIIVLFLSFFFPTFHRMTDEFGLRPSSSYRWLQSTWDGVNNHLILVCTSILATAWLFWSSRSQRFFRRHFADRLSRPNSLARSAQLLRMLSIAVEAGRPLAGSLSTLAKYHFDPSLRRRLLLARNEVEQGGTVWSSLVDAKLLSPKELQAINSTNNNRVQSWMLCRMASSKLESVEQNVLVRSALVQPMATLFFAVIVLWVCFSLFSFLTNLLVSLS